MTKAIESNDPDIAASLPALRRAARAARRLVLTSLRSRIPTRGWRTAPPILGLSAGRGLYCVHGQAAQGG